MQRFLETAQPRVVALILAAILLLTIVLQASYLLWPQLRRFQTISESHNVLREAVTGSEDLNLQLTSARAELARLGRQLHGDMAGLPVNQVESYIIGRLQKVSWDTGVELISVRPGRGQQVQMFQENLFEVEIVAGYFDFFTWLQTIGHELGFIVVQQYEIRPMGKELAQPKLKINLTMVSYQMVQA
jgi:Tfp pilus assembly protein PilO